MLYILMIQPKETRKLGNWQFSPLFDILLSFKDLHVNNFVNNQGHCYE